MKFNEKIARKKAEAESFRNLTGDAKPVERLNPLNNVLSVTVENTTTTKAKARIFGAIGTQTKEINNANGIVVTPANSTHQELLDTILADPFTLKGLKLFVKTNTSQFSNPLLVVDEDAFGSKRENTVIPIHSISSKDYKDKLVEIKDFKMNVRKTSYIEVDVEGQETVTMVFTISDKLERASELAGRPTLKTADPYKV